MSVCQAAQPRIYEFEALTDVWTGDIDGKAGRVITTGLLGSIRWWFEVLVRGLGGGACDPTQHGCMDREHCVVCELFGCTGWARKFRFDVLDMGGQPRRQQIEKNNQFQFRFTPLRHVRREEWALLDLTLRLIADYGAIGGKTVLKPSQEGRRTNEQHHQDLGLIGLIRRPNGWTPSSDELQSYVRRWRDVKSNGFAWASLEHFWCVKGRTLARQCTGLSTFNQVLGRKEPKRDAKRLMNGQGTTAQWLAGGTGKSKKVFSFRNPARTFGFVKPDTISHSDMRQRLCRVWPDLENREYAEGTTVFDGLREATEVS